MDTKDFNKATLSQLAALTGIDKHRWSRYLSGKVTVTEATLEWMAQRLDMTVDEMLKAIRQRRLLDSARHKARRAVHARDRARETSNPN